jgi:transketolase
MLIDMRDAFFEELVAQAKLNPNIVILSADHGAYALEEFARNNPMQYINIGIAEQNMVGVAAGLAISGKIVFIYGITPFVSLRVLEQLTIDVAMMQLPVNVISVGAGFTYSTDGLTHHGLQDMPAISSISGLTILNSSDPQNTKSFIRRAIATKLPHYIRIEKEKLAPFPSKRLTDFDSKFGYSILLNNDQDLLVISTGYLVNLIYNTVVSSPEELTQDFALIDLYQFNPIPLELIEEIDKYKKIIIFEESVEFISSQLLKLMPVSNRKVKTFSVRISVEIAFKGADRSKMLDQNGLSPKGIIQQINAFI